MTVLLQICCGPCTVYPLDVLQGEGIRVRGYFYNPNIHPFLEFKKRLAAVEELAALRNLPVDYHREYGLREYLRRVVFNEANRCGFCYDMRLLEAVEQAKRTRADAFTTTLLYSRYQQHDLICDVARQVAAEAGGDFYYEDFRRGWAEGVAQSKAMRLYRQNYCGCLFSERERILKPGKKARRAKGPN